MSRKALFLTPSTPDKPGELIEVPVASAAQQQFMPHVPYFERSTNLTDAERGKLEQERRDLQQSLPRLGFGERARAEVRIQEIERELMSEIDAEREEHRDREQPSLGNPMKGGGRPDSSNAQNSSLSSLSWAQLGQLIPAAMAEMRRVGAVK